MNITYLPNPVSVLFSEPKIPQFTRSRAATGLRFGFSALQRAENSSIHRERPELNGAYIVSVLFSEPKIPQCILVVQKRQRDFKVSVLFSEPKIPQSV